MSYEKILAEMKQKLIQQQTRYEQFTETRHKEFVEAAIEADLDLDRRRRRNRMKRNAESGN